MIAGRAAAGGKMAVAGPLEVEWQFDAPNLDRVEAWLQAQPPHAALTLARRGEKVQRDTYFDTPAWHVQHAAYTLRVREVGDGRETTLKGKASRGDGPISRTELNEPIDLPDALEGDGEVGRRLRLIRRGAPLRPLFTVTTHRRVWLAQAGTVVLAEIALDDTTVASASGVTSTLRRVEIEEVTRGSLSTIEAFVAAIRAECALTPAATSKFEAGLSAAGWTPGPPDLGPTETSDDDRVVDRAYAVLRRRTGGLLITEGGTALGEDVEQLHDMRVATRRLRAALRVFEDLIPPPLLAASDELRWFAQSLGAVRDLDVQLEHLEVLRRDAAWAEATALAPLVAQFEAQRVEARAELLAAMDGERYARMMDALRSMLLAGPSPDAPDLSSRGAGREIIRKRHRRFRQDATALRRSSPHAEFHELRIRGKRLRYSLELFVDLYGRPGARALTSLRAVQDLLGELQDLATTDIRLRDLVSAHPTTLPTDTLVMVGRLFERHVDRSAAIIDAFPRARRAVLRDFVRLDRAMRPPRRADVPSEEPAPPPEPSPTTPSMALVPVSPVRRRPAPGGALRALLRLVRRRPNARD